MKVMTIGELIAQQQRPTAYEDAVNGRVKKPYDEEPTISGHTLLSNKDGEVISLTHNRFFAPVMELLYNSPELFRAVCGKNMYIIVGLGDLDVRVFDKPGTAHMEATPVLKIGLDGALTVLPKHGGDQYKFANIREFVSAQQLDDTAKAVSVRRAYNEIVGLM